MTTGDDGERDAATWEAAAAQVHVQTQALVRSLERARSTGRIPEELVGLGAVVHYQSRVDLLRAVEASRWQRDAARLREDAGRWREDAAARRVEAERLRRAVWALAGVSGLSLLCAVVALVCCATARG